MSANALQVKPFNFLGLPLVLQTQVAHHLSKDDLVAPVSKAVKRVFDNSLTWVSIAKGMYVTIQDSKNAKQSIVAEQARLAKEANSYLLSGANGTTEKWTSEAEKKRLSAIPDPFTQRSELISHYQTRLKALRSASTHIIPGAYTIQKSLESLLSRIGPSTNNGAKLDSSVKYKLEVAKILLRSGVEYFGNYQNEETKRTFCSAGETIGVGIFKAYIAGKKATAETIPIGFADEITMAIDQNCPIFLRFLLQEEIEWPMYYDIAEVIRRAIKEPSVAVEEMWKIILEKYHTKPRFYSKILATMHFLKKNPKFTLDDIATHLSNSLK